MVLEESVSVLGLSVADLLGWLGITAHVDQSGKMDNPYWLTEMQRTKLSTVMRVSEQTIIDASFSFFDKPMASSKRHWVSPDVTRQTRNNIAEALRITSSTCLCPRCLAERRSPRLVWRTGWLFACIHHQVLLNETCPRCHSPFGMYRRQTRIPHLARCENHPPKGECCEQSLTDMSTISIADYPRLIRSQGRLEAALNGRTPRFVGQRTTPIEYLHGLSEVVEFLKFVAVGKSLGALPTKILELFETHVQARHTHGQEIQTDAELETTEPSQQSPDASNLLAAVISTTLEIADLNDPKAAEDRLMLVVETACADHPANPQRVFDYIRRFMQRQRYPRLSVVFKELARRVQKKYKLYEQTDSVFSNHSSDRILGMGDGMLTGDRNSVLKIFNR